MRTARSERTRWFWLLAMLFRLLLLGVAEVGVPGVAGLEELLLLVVVLVVEVVVVVEKRLRASWNYFLLFSLILFSHHFSLFKS